MGVEGEHQENRLKKSVRNRIQTYLRQAKAFDMFLNGNEKMK